MGRKRSDDAPKRPARSGVPMHAWVDDAIAQAFDAYVGSTEPRVSKTAALETALKEFLKARGFWPPPPQT